MTNTTNPADEILKRMKRLTVQKIFGSVALAAFGVILLVFSNQAVEMAVRVLGAFLVIIGVALILNFLLDRSGFGSVVSAVLGGIILIIGAYIFARPATIVAMFGLIAGILFIVNGCDNIRQSIVMAKGGYGRWFVSMVLGILAAMLGLACVFKPFGLSNFLVSFVGVVMIINAVFNLVVISGRVKTAKIIYQETTAVDTEGVVIDSEPIDQKTEEQ